MLLAVLMLSACVTVSDPEEDKINVGGMVGAQGVSNLPVGSVVTVAIIDVKQRGAILAQKRFSVAKLPTMFKFQLPAEAINKEADYVVVSLVKNNDRLLFQTYQRFPVINNGETMVQVTMERAR